ncbi:50S ribosomal protein L25 [Brevibacillus fluminis]|uniref:50S ribosomal protein L25 n=1 Tax=Brevibacillus fluminis TaxID=511487 RepID=UPI003F8A637F
MEAIQATVRQTGNKGANLRLRNSGMVPGVVYGKEVNNLSIQMDALALDQALRHQTTNKPFSLQIDGQQYQVMVYELQRHPVKGNVLHADFKQINMNEKVHTSVPIVITGAPELGVATLVRHSVEVKCLPNEIPEVFSVNVDDLNIGDVILVSDLHIPANIELGIDEMEVVISILPPKAKSEEAQDAELEAKAQAEDAAAKTQEAHKV